MKCASYNFDLLKATERRSSSPIRLRILMPIVAILACIGMVAWWGVLFAQTMMIEGDAKEVEASLDAKKKDHSDVLAVQAKLREQNLEANQLALYTYGVRHVGSAFAALAAEIPQGVQITQIKIPPPPEQDLIIDPKTRKPTLWGPTNNTERQVVVLSGRTVHETRITSLGNVLSEPAFSCLLVPSTQKDIDFGTDESAEYDGRKLVKFTQQYDMPGRRFGK